jgi:hypothetical protein
MPFASLVEFAFKFARQEAKSGPGCITVPLPLPCGTRAGGLLTNSIRMEE